MKTLRYLLMPTSISGRLGNVDMLLYAGPAAPAEKVVR
jgi:hypothetical protein